MAFSGGDPLFATELIRHSTEPSGGDLTRLGLIVASVFEGLDDASEALVTALAVIDRPVSFRLAARAARLDPGAGQEAARDLAVRVASSFETKTSCASAST